MSVLAQVREAFIVDAQCLPQNLVLRDLRNVNMYIYFVHEGAGLRRKVNRRETGDRRLRSRSVCESAIVILRRNELTKYLTSERTNGRNNPFRTFQLNPR